MAAPPAAVIAIIGFIKGLPGSKLPACYTLTSLPSLPRLRVLEVSEKLNYLLNLQVITIDACSPSEVTVIWSERDFVTGLYIRRSLDASLRSLV